MTQGLKISKEGSNIDDTDPRHITLDTRQPGAMKIGKKIIFKQDPKHPVFMANGKTAMNTQGVLYGTFTYEHKFGFAPAFLCYRVETDIYNDQLEKRAIILPTFGPFGNDLQSVTSDKKYVTVNNLFMDPNDIGRGTDYWIVLFIFQEDLDANV